MPFYFFTTALLAVLTPSVFFLTAVTWAISESLSSNFRQHLINSIFFGGSVFVGVLYSSWTLLEKPVESSYTFFSNIAILLIGLKTIFILLWFILQWKLMSFPISHTSHLLFRFLGMLILGASVGIGTLSMMGPLMGSFIVEQQEQSLPHIQFILFGFGATVSVGIPFLLGGKAYPILTGRKAWKIAQILLVLLTLFTSLINAMDLLTHSGPRL